MKGRDPGRLIVFLLLSAVFHFFLARGFMRIKFHIREMVLFQVPPPPAVVHPVRLTAPPPGFPTSRPEPASRPAGGSLSPSVGSDTGEKGRATVPPSSPAGTGFAPSSESSRPPPSRKTGPADLNSPGGRANNRSFDPYGFVNSPEIRKLMRKKDQQRYRHSRRSTLEITGPGGKTIHSYSDDSFEYGDLNPGTGTDITPWARQVLSLVLESWKSLDRAGYPGSTRVKVTFGRDGNLEHVIITDSSRNPLFDQQVRQALMLNIPYPPLPAELNRSEMTVSLEFTHEN